VGNLPWPGGIAWAVNDGGQVVGEFRREVLGRDPVATAFIWESGTLRQLENPFNPDYAAVALGINEGGTVVGLASSDETYQNAIMWRDSEVIRIPALRNGSSSKAEDINELDEVTGYGKQLQGPANLHAWIYADGVTTDIHGFGRQSYAYAINNFGDIVGFVSLSNQQFDWVAFLWTRDEGMIDLNTRIPPRSGYEITNAEGINDAGQIAAIADLFGFGNYGVLLNPVHPSMTLTPTGGALVAGRLNELVIRGATPGRRVYFAYAEQGGGSYIPGCTLQENALQLQNPTTLGSAVADADGVARLQRYIPRPALGKTLLLQAVVPGECAVSELIVETIE